MHIARRRQPVSDRWTFVFGQEICIPRTEAEFWKDDRLSAADWDDVANKVVSSLVIIHEIGKGWRAHPNARIGIHVIQDPVDRDAANRAGASTQPCLTPDVVRNFVDSSPPWRTLELVCSCRATIRSRRMFGIPLLRSYCCSWIITVIDCELVCDV